MKKVLFSLVAFIGLVCFGAQTAKADLTVKKFEQSEVWFTTVAAAEEAFDAGWADNGAGEKTFTSTKKKMTINPSLDGDETLDKATNIEGLDVKNNAAKTLRIKVRGLEEFTAYGVCTSGDEERVLAITIDNGKTIYSEPSLNGTSVVVAVKDLNPALTYTIVFQGFKAEDKTAGGDMELYAIKFKAGKVSIANTVETAYTASQANAIVAAGDDLDTKVYVKGTVSKIEQVSTQYGNATFYLTDGFEEFYIYRAYAGEDQKIQAENELQVGDEVVVYGKLVNYKGNTPEMTTGGSLISVKGATPWVGDYIVPGGVYYLYNPEAKAFLTGGNSWGTRAVFRGDAYPVTLEEVEGGYNLKLVTNQWLGDNLYVDVTPGGVFEIEQVGSYGYTIKHGDGYLGVTDNDEVNNIEKPTRACYWQFITKPRFIAELKDATADNPIDATPLIGCSNFNREDHSFETAWNRLHVGGNGGAVGGDNTNFCYEVWNSSTDGFEFNQTITNLPAGTYKLTAQAFYRQGSPAEDVAAVEGGYVIDVPVTLYANDAKKVILAERTQLGAIDEGTSTALGKYADSMTQASHYFSAGCYVNTVCVEIGENEPLTIGMVKEGGVAYDWFICDNFQLTYYGDGISAAELQDEADKVIAADGLAKAIAALSTKLASAKNALQLASGGDVDGLVAAIANAEKAIADGEKALKEGTSKEMNAAAAAADAAGKAIDEAKANVEFVPVVESPWAGDAVFSGAIAAFYNPATGNFLNQGNAWGTQASRADGELRFTITENEEGLYKIVTNNYPDRVFGWDAGSGFYVDITTQAVSSFKFELVETADPAQKVYTIWVEATKADGSATLSGYLCTSPDNTVVDVKNTMDEYCFWQFLDRTAKQSLENAISEAKAGAYTAMALQTTDPDAPGYLWTNAQEPSEGPIANLLDGNTGTFFHTIWSGDSEPPHYLAVDLGEGKSMSQLIFSYTRRMNNNNNRPTEMRIEGSNDNENYTEICTLTEAEDGLPTVAGNDSYTSAIIEADKAYRYFRFVVLATNNGATSGSQDAVFFTFSEFGLLQLSDNYDAIMAAVEDATNVLENEYALKADYVAAEGRLKAALGGALNGTFYLYNPQSGMFLSRGAAWGTEACLDDYGLPFVISTDAEGITKLSSLDWTDKVISYIDGTDGGSYVDGDGRDSNFSVEAVDGGYIFKNAAAQYLGIEDNANTKALYGIGSHASKEDALVFQLLTPTEYNDGTTMIWLLEMMVAADMAGVELISDKELYEFDCTDKIQSASLVNGYNGWTWTPGLYRGGNLTSNENGLECYQGTGVLSQTIEGLEPGLYVVSVNGYFRINGQRVGNVDWYNAGYAMSTVTLSANDYTTCILPVGADAKVVGTTIYPNWMSEASACFDEDLYENMVFTYVGEDGKLEIAVRQPAWNNECWLMMRDVTLTRLSNEPNAMNGEEGTTGISRTTADVINTALYTASGAATSAPVKGMNIVKKVLSDGSVKVEKVFVK